TLLLACLPEFGDAIPRRQPGSGENKEHGLAAMGALLKALQPTLSRNQTAMRVDVEKEIVPAARHQPVSQRQSLRVVRARMADEDPRHGHPAVTTVESGSTKKHTKAELQLHGQRGRTGSFSCDNPRRAHYRPAGAVTSN